MTNLEWLYEHDGYFNSFAKLMACLRGFATDEFTANEWLRQEHYEPNPDCSAMLYKTFTENMKHEPCSDYEPKDDAVSIMRECAETGHSMRVLRGRLGVECVTGWQARCLGKLADMVERDYMRRESVEEVMDNDRALVEENSMLARELLKLRAELEKATNNLNSANNDFENARAELTAERDELQSKLAEYEDRSMQYVMLTGGKFYTGTKALTERIAELTAELDAAKQQISQFDAPKSVETSENPASKCEISDFDDSRDKLEADVREWIDIATYKTFTPERMLEVMLHWLDRQAAITHREVLCQPDERDEQIAELTAKVKRWANAANGQRLVAMAQADKVQELTAERDQLTNAINELQKNQPYCYNPEQPLDSLNAIGRYIDELTAERDNLKANNLQLHTLAGEQAAKIDELTSQGRNTSTELVNIQELAIKLKDERDKAREESVELYSDLVKASDEREHYREKCSKMATIIHDALMVMDEGMA